MWEIWNGNTFSMSVLRDITDEAIKSWILDLSDSSDMIKEICDWELDDVIGQKWAKRVLENILEEVISWVNLRKEWYRKPIASMIFAWPSWVWKTLLARVTQKILNKHFRNSIEAIKVNCADFAWDNGFWITRLTWASAWYIGSDRKPLFHPDNIEWKGRVILFDEIEKAWPAFWNILLSILDDGTLDIDHTEMDEGKSTPLVFEWKWVDSIETSSLRAFFEDTVIIMTSNVWNDRIEKEFSWTPFGFSNWNTWNRDIDMQQIILEEFWKQFRIEMQGRFDYVVPFEHLTEEDAQKIIDQIINRLITNILSQWNGFVIEFTPEAKNKITQDVVSSPDFKKFWWRFIEWYFKKNITPYVARAINTWNFRWKKNKWDHECLIVTEMWGKIVFSKIPIWRIDETREQVKGIVDGADLGSQF